MSLGCQRLFSKAALPIGVARGRLKVVGLLLAVSLLAFAACSADQTGPSWPPSPASDTNTTAQSSGLTPSSPGDGPTTTAQGNGPTTSTTTLTETADTRPETVTVGGITYTCDRETSAGWECSSGTRTVFCSGRLQPADCSESWYPDELANFRLVQFEGRDYLCERVGQRCVVYRGGSPPISIFSADIWCNGMSCTPYDPDEWFEVRVGLTDYICEERAFRYGQYDCYHTYDGLPPATTFGNPDVYCSGTKAYPNCSPYWYPDELAGVEIITYNGALYVCDWALMGGFDDYDCGAYDGGDPSHVYTYRLKCTKSFGGFECRTDFYPSELEGVYFATIDFADHVCKDTFQGSECFRYWGGSPKNATWGLPDYYCNYRGCSPYGYP